MSTSVDSQRGGFWSYIPFTGSPRRRSVSLPTRTNGPSSSSSAGWDPFEKSDRHTSSGLGHTSPTIRESLQNAWMTQSQRARYVKTGGIIVFVFIVLYYVLGDGFIPGANSMPVLPPQRSSLTTPVSPTYTPSDSPTARCTRPHDSSKPLIQYAIMIDAGSTGSRIHVYRFNNCGPAPELEHEEFKMTEKRPEGSGLSSYKTDVDGAAKSLDPLLEVAMRTVPDEHKSCSPIAVKATAGLRLLGDEMSAKILDAVRTRLETAYPFPVVSREKGGVEIMSGAAEGVYAWITTNYLLGNIGSAEKTPTAAVFDLGGGSTQIVFEPTFRMPTGQLADGEHKYALSFGGRHFTLYQHSHLGYGLMSARATIHRLVVENMHASHPDSTAWLDQPVPNPCLATNTTRRVSLDLAAPHPLSPSSPLAVDMHGPASDAHPAHCRALVEHMLGTDAACALPPCSFNGVHQPSLGATVPSAPLYLVSYFYDRTAPLGMPDSFSLRELMGLTAQVCAGEDAWADLEAVVGGGGGGGVLTELRSRPEWCLDLSYMAALLHAGYGLELSREVRVAKTIRGNELGWCLGASLPLLERGSGWECRLVREAGS